MTTQHLEWFYTHTQIFGAVRHKSQRAESDKNRTYSLIRNLPGE